MNFHGRVSSDKIIFLSFRVLKILLPVKLIAFILARSPKLKL